MTTALIIYLAGAFVTGVLIGFSDRELTKPWDALIAVFIWPLLLFVMAAVFVGGFLRAAWNGVAKNKKRPGR